jgi:hypothetical protein
MMMAMLCLVWMPDLPGVAILIPPRQMIDIDLLYWSPIKIDARMSWKRLRNTQYALPILKAIPRLAILVEKLQRIVVLQR